MLLSYETSSISYDQIDLIHGKFVPAKPMHSCHKSKDIRFFINIYGVFADLTGAFAKRYDDHVIPTVADCVLDPSYIINNISKSGVEAMMEEDGFWLDVMPYNWYMLLMSEFYKICDGEYHFLLPQFDNAQLDDRMTWVWRHFGSVNKNRTLLLNMSSANELLIKSRNDVFIGSDLMSVEQWTLNGGSGFWWPEIEFDCKDAAKFLVKRVTLLDRSVQDLRDLSE